MKLIFRSLIAATLILAATSCTRVSSSQSDEKIVRGRLVTESSPAFTSAVRLEMGGGLCTGSIIGPRLILTAAHCVADTSAEQISVYFDKFPAGDKNSVRRGVKLETFKPFGAALFPNFDIAWVQLDEDVPAPYAPIEILRDPKVMNETTPIILAGYGKQADVCTTANCIGELREANTVLKQYYDKAHIMSLLVFHGPAELGLGGACNGDSGGPAYAQVGTKWYLIGVTNGTRGDITPESDNLCNSGWDIYTYAGDYLSWLEKSAAVTLKHDDAAANPDRTIAPLVVSGIEQKTKPTQWSAWVNYANHEDPAYYTVDSILQYFVNESGIEGAGATAVLFDPSLTEEKAGTTTSLYVSGDTVSDLSPLASFWALKELTLDSTNVTDLSPLSAKSLTYLGIRKFGENAPANVVDTLGAARKNLEEFDVEAIAAPILSGTDWTAFNQLKKVSLAKTVGILDLSRIKPRLLPEGSTLDISASDVTGQLKLDTFFNATLSLRSLQTADAAGLQGVVDWASVSSLSALSLDHFETDVLPDFTSFPGLKTLTLNHQGLKSLKDLKLPPKLEKLDVSGNQLVELEDLESKIDTIKAYDNPFQNKACPAENCETDIFVSPRSLDQFCANAVDARRNEYDESYAALLLALQRQLSPSRELDCDILGAGAGQLRNLDLSASDIIDVRPLGYLTAVKNLYLDSNAIEDITPLANLTTLENLSLVGNNLRAVPSLASLAKLTTLNLMDNPLTELNADAPLLKKLYIGFQETPPEGLMPFNLSFPQGSLIDGLYEGSLDLLAESKTRVHGLLSLRTLYFADDQVVDTSEWDDMLSLSLVSSYDSSKEECPLVNGSCVTPGETGNTTLLGPLLGTTAGTRVTVTAPSVNLPGLEQALILSTTP